MELTTIHNVDFSPQIMPMEKLRQAMLCILCKSLMEMIKFAVHPRQIGSRSLD